MLKSFKDKRDDCRVNEARALSAAEHFKHEEIKKFVPQNGKRGGRKQEKKGALQFRISVFSTNTSRIHVPPSALQSERRM